MAHFLLYIVLTAFLKLFPSNVYYLLNLQLILKQDWRCLLQSIPVS